MKLHLILAAVLLLIGTGCQSGDSADGSGNGIAQDGSIVSDADIPDAVASDAGVAHDGMVALDSSIQRAHAKAELWYSIPGYMMHVILNTDGSVKEVIPNPIEGLVYSLSPLTMLQDGSILGMGKKENDDSGDIYFFHVPNPPEDDSKIEYQTLGKMTDGIQIEALYTDCNDRIYGMDTGTDDTSAEGNRLLLFTSDILGGEVSYQVVSDLATADVADIDDMSPGIDKDGNITDNPGFAMDTSHVYDFDYQEGTGVEITTAGLYGIHALGGELFADGKSRLFVTNGPGDLFEVNPQTFEVSEKLSSNPNGIVGKNHGMTGPLTQCESGFLIE